MPTIIFTGGGSAGHVTPNFALMEKLAKKNLDIHYLGSKSGIEKTLVDGKAPYHGITCGKLRRYKSWRNFFTPFQVLLGIAQATWLCFKLKPTVVFSKGGFVAFPVVVGAFINRVPVFAHESDLTPGLANKLSYPFCNIIFVTFEQTLKYFPKGKAIYSGTPIRATLLTGTPNKGHLFCHFKESKPVILFMGGSLGSDTINQAVFLCLETLCQTYNVIHLCGKGKVNHHIQHDNYRAYEYLEEPLPDLFALADIVISRAGANTIYELLALRKPHILIPLSHGSRGDQLLNAKHFEQLGLSTVIQEKNLSADQLLMTIDHVFERRTIIIARLEDYELKNSVDIISSKIDTVLAKVQFQSNH